MPEAMVATPAGPPRMSERQWQIVTTTYAHHLESVDRNEELGERRVQLLFAVISAAGVAVGLVANAEVAPRTHLWVTVAAAMAIGLFALLTVGRLVRRNRQTTKLLIGLRDARCRILEREELGLLFAYDPFHDKITRTQALLPIKGGLVDLAGSIAAAFIGTAALLTMLILVDGHDELAVGVGAMLTVVIWFATARAVSHAYARDEVQRQKDAQARRG